MLVYRAELSAFVNVSELALFALSWLFENLKVSDDWVMASGMIPVSLFELR